MYEGLADSNLSIDGTKLPFFTFLQANSTTSGRALAHPKTPTPLEPANLQFVFRLLGHFAPISRVILVENRAQGALGIGVWSDLQELLVVRHARIGNSQS